MFFSDLLLDTNYKLKNRYMHIYYVEAVIRALERMLNEIAILKLISKNPSIKQVMRRRRTNESAEKQQNNAKRMLLTSHPFSSAMTCYFIDNSSFFRWTSSRFCGIVCVINRKEHSV